MPAFRAGRIIPAEPTPVPDRSTTHLGRGLGPAVPRPASPSSIRTGAIARPGRDTVTDSDRTLTCVDCGVDFVHSIADQEYYAQKGFVSDPKRCGARSVFRI